MLCFPIWLFEPSNSAAPTAMTNSPHYFGRGPGHGSTSRPRPLKITWKSSSISIRKAQRHTQHTSNPAQHSASTHKHIDRHRTRTQSYAARGPRPSIQCRLSVRLAINLFEIEHFPRFVHLNALFCVVHFHSFVVVCQEIPLWRCCCCCCCCVCCMNGRLFVVEHRANQPAKLLGRLVYSILRYMHTYT